MKRGFGTNFHKIYKNKPKIYDIFSSSEIFSYDLLSRIKTLLYGDVLLDVACGTCHKTNLISKYFTKVYALDVSKSFLEYARKKYKTNKKITYLLSSASSIPLLDNSVDTIFISWGSFPLSKTITEMKRVLKPGGVIIRIGAEGKDDFTKLFPDFDLKRIKRIQNVFKQANFSQEKYDINIKFNNIKKAKSTLSVILGINKKLITSNIFNHNVLLSFYKKR